MESGASLKSGAGALGAARLFRRCREIETCARHSGIEAARPLLVSLDHDVAEAMYRPSRFDWRNACARMTPTA